MCHLAALILLALLASTPVALADNSRCWGYNSDDPTRPVFSCTPITERLLLNLHSMSKMQVMKAMNAKGRVIRNGSGDQLEEIRFLSNADQGSGFVNVTFKDGRAFIVHAYVDAQQGKTETIEYIWNVELGGCSDFPKSRNTCRFQR